jgi:MFS family permease
MHALNIHTACLAAICAHSFYTAARLVLIVSGLQLTRAAVSVGVIMMAYALLPAILSPLIGRVADKRGSGLLVRFGLSLLIASGVAVQVLPEGASTLVVLSAAIGLAFNCFAVGIQKTIGDLPATSRQGDLQPAERRKLNFGTLATASSISAFAGPLLAGWGLDHFSFPSVLCMLAALPLAAWLMSWTWAFRRPAAGGSAKPQGAPGIPLMKTQLIPIFVMIAMLTVAGESFAFLTPMIGSTHSLSASTIGGILSAYAAGAFVIRLASGTFIARLPDWTYLTATLFAAAAILLLYSRVTTAMQLTVLSFVLGAWLGLAQPMTQSLLHRSVPEGRVGEVLGVRLAVVGAAQAASPLLLGFGVQAYGTGFALIGTSLALVIAGVFAARTAARLTASASRD